MVKWIQEKPEALAYIRSQYTDGALPNCVGKLEGNADYAEILRGAGVSVPMGDTMEVSVADASVADDSDKVNAEEEDIAQGTIPVQGSATGDVDPEPETPSDTQEQTQVPTHIHQQQHPDAETPSDTQEQSETPSDMQAHTQTQGAQAFS